MKRIPLIKPYMTDEMKIRVCEVLDSGYMTEGPVTHEFENARRDYMGCEHALAVCNCTVGLEMALRAYGIGPKVGCLRCGSDIICMKFTWTDFAILVYFAFRRWVLQMKIPGAIHSCADSWAPASMSLSKKLEIAASI